jgi:hypothetical protein
MAKKFVTLITVVQSHLHIMLLHIPRRIALLLDAASFWIKTLHLLKTFGNHITQAALSEAQLGQDLLYDPADPSQCKTTSIPCPIAVSNRTPVCGPGPSTRHTGPVRATLAYHKAITLHTSVHVHVTHVSLVRRSQYWDRQLRVV